MRYYSYLRESTQSWRSLVSPSEVSNGSGQSPAAGGIKTNETAEYFLPKFVVKRSKSDESAIEDETEAETETGLLGHADLYSRISLTWMNPMILTASQAKMTLNTLPAIDVKYDTENSSIIFQENWNKRKDDSVVTFILVLVKSFGSSIAYSACFELLYDIVGFASPFFVRYLILFADSYLNEDEGNKPKPLAIGIYIAIGMFSINILRTIFATNLFLFLLRTITSLRGSLYSAVYRKSLVLSNKERQGRSTGEIVNIMAVDLVTIISIVWSITNLWESPIQFILCLYTLNKIVGKSVFSAVVVLIIFFPINWYLTRYIKILRKKQMKYKDQRTRLTTEIFTNVKSLKLYGWEKPLLERLHHVRNELQLKNLRNMILFNCLVDLVWTMIPYFITCSTFGLYAYLEEVPLTADIIFPCITLFDMMTAPLNDIPRMITMIVDSSVSFVRVRDFLVSRELQSDAVIRLPPVVNTGDESIEIKGASFLWDEDDKSSVILENINFKAHKGDLFCIVGRVGAGKTSFLKALLGDLYRQQGSVTTRGSIAYVAQDPWLVNGSVKDNILFGCRYDAEFYQRTIEACALIPDLEILPDGDKTEIGERGVSLSGGQKARLALARAVYARADIYLLDDCLSAVDEHVKRHITENVIAPGGLLASKTIILATNAIGILSKAHNITLLQDKSVREQKTFSQVLSEKSGLLYELIEEFGGNYEEELASANSSVTDVPTDIVDYDANTSSAQLSRKSSITTLRKASIASYTKKKVKGAKFTTATKTNQSVEDSQVGRVKWHVYKRYVDACGYVALSIGAFFIAFACIQGLLANFWLKAWAEENAKLGKNEHIFYWMVGYLALGLLSTFINAGRRVFARIQCGLTASRILHDQMAYTVLRSPMSFFETTPVGRIINRFSSDINELDEGLPVAIIDLARTITQLLVSLGVVIYGAPSVLLIMIPLSGLYYYYQFYYQSASRELKRLLSISRSPIFAHFQESLNGISTIRAFDQGERFKHMNTQKIDGNIRAVFLFRSANRWLSFRLQSIGATIVLATAITIVVGSTQKLFSPGLIGIMMTYTVQVTEFLSWIVKAIVNLETSVVGVERVLEYCDLPNEAPEVIENQRPPAYWPTDGHVSYKGYSTRYRSGLDLVLKDINLDIKPREKIGIVGRTGAGKSSLVMSLFRIIEPSGGTIEIDNQDITQMGLLDLRSHLSIIPQDSQVFEGTLRQNLDPVGTHSDDELWRVLELSHLKDHVSGMEGGLDAAIAEGGSNLSSGERQMMSLARALLHDSSVVIFDEATSNVDLLTEKLLKNTLKENFGSKTIITIAHRINTILDSDRIVVLEKGQVAEFDSPENLLKNENSLFYSLCKQGGFLKDESSSESS